MKPMGDAHGRLHRWLWAGLEAAMPMDPMVMSDAAWANLSAGWNQDRAKCYAPCCESFNRSNDVARRMRSMS